MEFIQLTKREHIGVITLSRPPANALTYQVYKELYEVFELVEKDPEIWAVVFRSEGKFFCAGNDLNELDASAQGGSDGSEYEIHYGDMVEKGLSAIIKCKVPVICCVHGTAVGAGFCIASYSDIVLASEKAKFGITEITVGIIGGAPEASYSLPPKVVRYMALTGNLLTAEQAYNYNMVIKIVPEEAMLDEAVAIAERIITHPPLAMKLMKQSLNNIYEPERIAKKIEFDGEKTMEHLQSEDYKEALRAFIEKRKPVFHGR
jgi:enoyl-CoA hydratase/carnithine racemase